MPSLPNGYEPASRPAERRAQYDLRRLLAGIWDRVDALETLTTYTQNWQVPSALNVNWANVGGTSQVWQGRRINDKVTLRGVIRINGGANPMTTLPTWARPLTVQDFPGITREATPRALNVRISPSGAFEVFGIAVNPTDFAWGEIEYSVS